MKTYKNKNKGNHNTRTRKRISPRTDFYSNINYLWIKKESHAKDKDMTMDLIIKKKVHHELEFVVLKKLLEEKSFNGEQVRNIYKASVHWNNDLVEKKILTFVSKLNSYREKPDTLYEFIGWFTNNGFETPLGFDIEINAQKTHQYISHLTESGLMFMSRPVYFSEDKKYKLLRKNYACFLKKIFIIVFGKNHKYNVQKIFDIEKMIAQSLLEYEDVLYIKNTYNVFTPEKCEKELHFDWNKFSRNIGFKIPPKTLIVENPKYVEAIIKHLKNWSSEEWLGYWVFQIIRVAHKFHKTLFYVFTEFMNKASKVVLKKTIDLKNLALSNVETYMNVTISKKYIALFKNEKEIAYTKNLLERFKTAFKTRLSNNKWLHADTKNLSLKKLNNMVFVVGCKEKWENDPRIEYSPVDAWENYALYTKWSIERDIASVGKPIPSKNVWIQMEDQNVYDVNAYYNSLENELIFPNAILQPPFVNTDKDMACNLASIGVTIGHEMLHAFDDDGYYYDDNGLYVENGWWQENDKKAYEKKQEKVVKQYEAAGLHDNLKLDGKLTLTENIADIGGFLLTEDVLIEYLNEKEIYGERQDKYLRDFYMNYARVWRSNQSLKYFSKKINEDEHSYSKYRVNCVLANSEHFKRIFGIKQGDQMYFEREEIW